MRWREESKGQHVGHGALIVSTAAGEERHEVAAVLLVGDGESTPVGAILASATLDGKLVYVAEHGSWGGAEKAVLDAIGRARHLRWPFAFAWSFQPSPERVSMPKQTEVA